MDPSERLDAVTENANSNNADSDDTENPSPKLLFSLIKELAKDIKSLKQKRDPLRIDTSPQRETQEGPTPQRTGTPIDFIYDDDEISLRVSDSSHDEDNSILPSGTITQKIFSSIKTASVEDQKGPAVDAEWGKIVNENWSCKKDKDNMKKLRAQYPIPSNCEVVVPKLNMELWQLINPMQRKSDIMFSQIQRNLAASVAASLSVATSVVSDKINKKEIVQTIANLVALLGEASSEISKKRKLFIRSVLKDEYKDLTALSNETTENLFGNNLSQNIKDLNLRNKLKTKTYNSYTKTKPYNRPNYGKYSSSSATNNHSYLKEQNFLGNRRRSWSSSNSNNKNIKKK